MTSTFSDCFSTPFFKVQKSSRLYGDDPYYRVVNEDGVILAVLDQDDRFILVKQFRPNLEMETLEFPAGGIEANETPQNAASRELWEETGVRATLLSLGTARLQMNRVVHREHLFFGIENNLPDEAIPESRQEHWLNIERIDRKEFFRRNKDSCFFEQLAALGVLQKASIHLEVNMISATFEEIKVRVETLLEQINNQS
jgi:8-oxo-dGTP pyrophosphatase MutT (NUDIX family)